MWEFVRRIVGKVGIMERGSGEQERVDDRKARGERISLEGGRCRDESESWEKEKGNDGWVRWGNVLGD